MNLTLLKIVRFFHLIDKEKYNLLRQIGFIEKSGMFNEEYYLEQNPNLARENIDPIEHYVRIGWKENCNPNEYFDNDAYLNIYPELYEKNLPPLFHYIRENQNILNQETKKNNFFKSKFNKQFEDYKLVANSIYFDVKWYLKQYPHVAEAKVDPIEHYLKIGWKLGYNPSMFFDTNSYLIRNKDVQKSGVNPLYHYLTRGIKEYRNTYIAKIGDFREQSPNLWDNFICHYKSKNPLISIIVASYNYADLIIKTLDSLVSQTYKNFEVIVVDDGSTDNSVKIIKKYVSKYPFIKLYRHKQGKNRGLPATIELGLAKSNGTYIAFCEADDYWSSNHLEEKVKIINTYANPKIIVNDVELFGDKSRCDFVQIIVNERKNRLSKTKNKINVKDFETKNWIVTFSCCMIKKDVLDKCNVTDTPRKANLDWWIYRQVCCDNFIFYVNKKLTCWNMHESYMTKENIDTIIRQDEFLMNMNCILFSKHPIYCIYYYKEYFTYKSKKTKYLTQNGILMKDNAPCQYQPSFSVIMATFNRISMIQKAINSILNQTYQNFELIIVDDGSTDGTQAFIQRQYNTELKSGKIKYIYKNNSGVCNTRNIGLQNANNDWITYLDSDNFMAENALEIFSGAIIEHKEYRIFYADLICMLTRNNKSHKFNLTQLLEENYIDLGVFCHHKSVYEKLGGFDENMTRLVDWDLIVRYTKEYKPYYINKTTLYYNDKTDYNRITTSVKLYDNMAYFRKKNCHVPTITTMITSYNHQDYIREAIESAIKQMGNFVHEIIISDDGSTDETPQIIAEYTAKYPHLIRNISDGKNIGISANMKKCFEAATGKYIAVLEGDDYWTDSYKLEKQMNFLEKNKDCSMVFSKLRIFNETKGKFSYLARQANLREKLTGDDVIKEETLNLIGNFSCTMFKKELMIHLPDVMFKTRLNEIAVSFYLVQKGKIGFISTPLSVYRMRDDSVWTGADRINKLKQGLDCRQMSLAVCANKYKKPLQKIIDEQYLKPLKENEEKEPSNSK